MRRNKKTCPICSSSISLSNFAKHVGSKSCLSGGKQIEKPSTQCKYCHQSFNTSIGRGIHELQCDKNINCRKLNQGRVAWNRGNRSKPDLRDPQFIGKRGGYRPNAGRSKKFKVFDSFGKETILQSTYELTCSQLLDEMSIKWVRPKALKYSGKNYFADFYLTDYDIYLDPKNDYKAKVDAEKIQKVVEENSVKLFVLLQTQITKEYIGFVIQW